MSTKANKLPVRDGLDCSLSLTLTAEQIRRIRRKLLRWGSLNFQIYSWRFESNSWLTFVAEFFLQRTRAQQVEKIYRVFEKRYPTPNDLLNDDVSEITRLMAPLGLAFRVGMLREIARSLVEGEGRLPETIEELISFRGVGMYTAAAWLSLHRGTRAILIDSNVCRWLSRMTGNLYNRDPRHVAWIKDLTEEMTPSRAFKDYNYAVLDFTMLVCRTRNPGCKSCPIREDCTFGSSRC